MDPTMMAGGGGGFGQGIMDWLGGKQGASLGDILKRTQVSAGFGNDHVAAGAMMRPRSGTDQQLLDLIAKMQSQQAAPVPSSVVRRIERHDAPQLSMSQMNDSGGGLYRSPVPSPLTDPNPMRMY